jgi:hypothetical protein
MSGMYLEGRSDIAFAIISIESGGSKQKIEAGIKRKRSFTGLMQTRKPDGMSWEEWGKDYEKQVEVGVTAFVEKFKAAKDQYLIKKSKQIKDMDEKDIKTTMAMYNAGQGTIGIAKDKAIAAKAGKSAWTNKEFLLLAIIESGAYDIPRLIGPTLIKMSDSELNDEIALYIGPVADLEIMGRDKKVSLIINKAKTQRETMKGMSITQIDEIDKSTNRWMLKAARWKFGNVTTEKYMREMMAYIEAYQSSVD